MRFQQRYEPFPFIKGKPYCITGDVIRLSIVVFRSKPGDLLYNDQRVILLAFLNEKILTINEVFGCYWLIESRELLLIQGYTTTLHELAHFALTWEDLHAFLVEDINCWLPQNVL